MTLTGIEIVVNGEPKFVGKVGRTPKNSIIPAWQNRIALYREVPFVDVYSHVTHSMGVDQAAWEKAEELGAEGMIICCKDRQYLYVASRELMATCRSVDLGEFPQIRVPIARIEKYPLSAFSSGLSFGWTKHVVRVEGRRTPRIIVEPEEVSNIQLGLF